MEKEVFQMLSLLKEKQPKEALELKLEKLEKLIGEFYDKESTIKGKYIFIKIALTSLNYILTEEKEKNKAKKALQDILGCHKEDIVYDENDIKKNADATVIAGSVRYSATFPTSYLRNKKIVWGNLDIRALEDTSCLQNLELVGGDLLVRDSYNLPNLKYVLGNVKKIQKTKTF